MARSNFPGETVLAINSINTHEDAGRIAADAVLYGATSAQVRRQEPDLFEVLVVLPAGDGSNTLVTMVKFLTESVGDPKLRMALGLPD